MSCVLTQTDRQTNRWIDRQTGTNSKCMRSVRKYICARLRSLAAGLSVKGSFLFVSLSVYPSIYTHTYHTHMDDVYGCGGPYDGWMHHNTCGATSRLCFVFYLPGGAYCDAIGVVVLSCHDACLYRSAYRIVSLSVVGCLVRSARISERPAAPICLFLNRFIPIVGALSCSSWPCRHQQCRQTSFGPSLALHSFTNRICLSVNVAESCAVLCVHRTESPHPSHSHSLPHVYVCVSMVLGVLLLWGGGSVCLCFGPSVCLLFLLPCPPVSPELSACVTG
mmetsp:Transcript_10813/g.31333  ORF Transcript_10813/g.31333 Transcript_10813/m.31333 type:complete len:278 (-) Transcript_10813:1834-2667(-)